MYWDKNISLLKLIQLNFSVQKYNKKFNNTTGLLYDIESFNVNLHIENQIHDFGRANMNKESIN